MKERNFIQQKCCLEFLFLVKNADEKSWIFKEKNLKELKKYRLIRYKKIYKKHEFRYKPMYK